VWRNSARNMGGMYQPEAGGRSPRGPFIKGGSNQPKANGGRAYYFDNSAPDAGAGLARSGGVFYNFVARNNRWPPSRVNRADGPFEIDR